MYQFNNNFWTCLLQWEILDPIVPIRKLHLCPGVHVSSMKIIRPHFSLELSYGIKSNTCVTSLVHHAVAEKKSVFHQGKTIYFGGLDAICNKLTVCLVEMKQIYFSLSVRNSALYPIYIASDEYVWGINQSKTSIIYHCGIYLTFGSDQRTLTTNGVTWIHNLFRYDCRSCFSIKIFKELIHETRSIIIYQQNKHSSTGVTWYTTNE